MAPNTFGRLIFATIRKSVGLKGLKQSLKNSHHVLYPYFSRWPASTLFS